jgi:hypothetical protein
LDLIRIRKDAADTDFSGLLAKLRSKAAIAPDPDTIAKEVEAVRKARYGK